MIPSSDFFASIFSDESFVSISGPFPCVLYDLPLRTAMSTAQKQNFSGRQGAENIRLIVYHSM
jgi:hypothetical protein